MKVIYYGNPILRKKSKQVGSSDENIKKILNDMETIVLRDKSVGLSGVQVGTLQRLVVIDRGCGLSASPCIVKLINPEILHEEGSVFDLEGCLSFPGLVLNIKRPRSLKVWALDENCKEIEIECDDILSRIIAHEIDHLNGTLFIDRASQIEKLKFLRWHKNIKKVSKKVSRRKWTGTLKSKEIEPSLSFIK